MPAPARTDRDRIVGVARELLEEGGVDAVTMAAVAERVGVRSPSLYKHVRDRGDLLGQVVDATGAEATLRLEAAQDDDPRRTVLRQAEEMRRFAGERPQGYALLFGTDPTVPRPGQDALRRMVQPLVDAMGALLGPEHALDGARLLVAWANGFITMELAGALRMGGDIDAAWEWGLQRIVSAVTSPA